MRPSRFVLTALAFALIVFGMLGSALAPAASAAGVQVYRTDSQGRKTGTVLNVGNTGPNAFCAGFGLGTIGFGVEVCYL